LEIGSNAPSICSVGVGNATPTLFPPLAGEITESIPVCGEVCWGFLVFRPKGGRMPGEKTEEMNCSCLLFLIIFLPIPNPQWLPLVRILTQTVHAAATVVKLVETFGFDGHLVTIQHTGDTALTILALF
jgi:hypothetical protein